MTVDGSETYRVEYSYDKNNRLLTEAKIEDEVSVTSTSTSIISTNGKSTVKKKTTTIEATFTETLTTYTYDPNGNTLTATTGNEVITYTYNARNQQTGYNGTVIVTYTYSPDGLRRSKQTSGFTLELFFVWSGGNMVYEYESLTPTQGIVYVYGINLISSNNNSGNDKYYLYNAHGDVVQLVNSSGTVVKEYKYDAFGMEYDIDENDTNYFRYTGQYFDIESGTYYLRARYYNPANGRFTQQDWWWLANPYDPLSLNLYIYCRHSPVRYYDPSGHTERSRQEVINDIDRLTGEPDFASSYNSEVWERMIATYMKNGKNFTLGDVIALLDQYTAEYNERLPLKSDSYVSAEEFFSEVEDAIKDSISDAIESIIEDVATASEYVEETVAAVTSFAEAFSPAAVAAAEVAPLVVALYDVEMRLFGYTVNPWVQAFLDAITVYQVFKMIYRYITGGFMY